MLDPPARYLEEGTLKGGRTTILLAEDEPSLRAALARALSHAGYELIPVASGADALAAVESNSFDVLITDLIMPGMSGRDLAREVAEKHGVVPTIYMSGYSDEALDELGPHERFVNKPFSIVRLIEGLREMLVDADAEEGDAGMSES